VKKLVSKFAFKWVNLWRYSVGAVGLHALKGQNIMRRMGVTVFG
jgi:hypothetical protein